MVSLKPIICSGTYRTHWYWKGTSVCRRCGYDRDAARRMKRAGPLRTGHHPRSGHTVAEAGSLT